MDKENITIKVCWQTIEGKRIYDIESMEDEFNDKIQPLVDHNNAQQ